MSAEPWGKYRIEPSKTPIDERIDVSLMPDLYHVAHFRDAQRIIEDRRLTASLVRDESVLNRSRICVLWASPNTWVDGSFYGNVRFVLPAHDFLREQRLYWIEAIEKYRPTALRILVTDLDLDKRFPRLDPTVLGQPIHRAEDGQWYRLDKYNYEIMLARDVGIDECTSIGVVKHHPTLCSDSLTCADKGTLTNPAARRWGAMVLGLGDKNIASIAALAGGSIHEGLVSLSRRFRKLVKSGVVKDKGAIAAIIKAAADADARGRKDMAAALLGTIHADENFDDHFDDVVRDLFGSEFNLDDF